MRKTIMLCCAALSAAFVGAAQAAPIDTLYVTDGDSSRLARVAGGTASTSSTFAGAYAIAVRDSIWIAPIHSSTTAREFDLNGTPTGASTPYPLGAIQAVDGAASRTHNYALGFAFGTIATVFQFAPDFSSPVSLFNVSGVDLVGITFDPVAGTLWISGAHNIYQYSLAGTLVSSFAHGSGRGSLAYEASSDTLWYVRNSSNSIDQYAKNGTLLGTSTIAGLSSNNWGAEFAQSFDAAIPEPATAALLFSGLFGLGLLRRQPRRR